MHFDKLGDIVNKYNNTLHKTIKLTPVDVNPSMDNKEGPKFKAVDNVIISEYKNIIPNGYALNYKKQIKRVEKVSNRKSNKLYVKME